MDLIWVKISGPELSGYDRHRTRADRAGDLGFGAAGFALSSLCGQRRLETRTENGACHH